MTLVRDFEERGFAVWNDVLDSQTTQSLILALQNAAGASMSRKEEIFGIRDLFGAVPVTRDLAQSPAIREIARSILGDKCFAVRGLFFDKTPEANWKVPFHQDLTIATREARKVSGYGPWTSKAGIPHVQPPLPVLENMVALRIHLDACVEENGALRVVPGSHRHGRLDARAIAKCRVQNEIATCCVGAGGVMAMRPLLLHASSPAALPCHRRVIHLEFANCELADGLQWHCRY